MTEPTPDPLPAPNRPLRRMLRFLVLGIALGAGTLVVCTPVWFRITSVLAALGPRPGPLSSVLGAIVLELPELLFAPLIAFAAGLLIQAPRFALVVPQVLAVQAMQTSIMLISGGTAMFAEPAYLATLAVGLGGGISLSAWSFARAGRWLDTRARAQRAQASTAGKLSQIDFEAVKKSQAEAPAPVAPSAPEPTDKGGAQG